MRILMVIGQFYPIIGGAERQCLKLSKALQARGHKVKILAVWNPRNVPRKDTVEDAPVERVWYPVFNAFEYRVGLGFLAPFFMFWRVYRMARQYDVIHVHQCLWPAFSATIAARLSKKPIVCKLGNSGERFDLEVLRKTHVYGRIAAWYVKRKMNKFVWTSKAVFDDLVREGVTEEKLVSIPNGVELPPHPNPLPQGERDKNNHSPPSVGGVRGGGLGNVVRFIFTGTFTPKKNLLSLIEAIRMMPLEYHEKIRLILLGDGPDREALTKAIKQYNLNGIMEIKGPVEEVGPYLEKSDVFVLPSSTEGLSNSALEAMAYGLPLILSNRGGNNDLIDEGAHSFLPLPEGELEGMGANGILVNPTKLQSLASAMQYMMDHPEERRQMGVRSRQIVEEKYALKKVARSYEQLYKIVYGNFRRY